MAISFFKSHRSDSSLPQRNTISTYLAYPIRVLIFQGIQQRIAITYTNMVIQGFLVNLIARRFAARGGGLSLPGWLPSAVMRKGWSSQRPSGRPASIRAVLAAAVCAGWRHGAAFTAVRGSPHRIRCERASVSVWASVRASCDLWSVAKEKAVSCRGPDLSLSSGYPSRPPWCVNLRSRSPWIRHPSYPTADTHDRRSRTASVTRTIAAGLVLLYSPRQWVHAYRLSTYSREHAAARAGIAHTLALLLSLAPSHFSSLTLFHTLSLSLPIARDYCIFVVIAKDRREQLCREAAARNKPRAIPRDRCSRRCSSRDNGQHR